MNYFTKKEENFFPSYIKVFCININFMPSLGSRKWIRYTTILFVKGCSKMTKNVCEPIRKEENLC